MHDNFHKDSYCPIGTRDELHHIVDILEFFSHIVRELYFEFVFNQHGQLHIVKFIQTCLEANLPNSQNWVLRFIFSTFCTPSKFAITLEILLATSLGLR
jgi:hypothetical protein